MVYGKMSGRSRHVSHEPSAVYHFHTWVTKLSSSLIPNTLILDYDKFKVTHPNTIPLIEAGVSKDPCAYTYPGRAPFSEACTNNIRKFLEPRKDDFILYLAFHAYSQLVLTPYGFPYERPPDYIEMVRLPTATSCFVNLLACLF